MRALLQDDAEDYCEDYFSADIASIKNPADVLAVLAAIEDFELGENDTVKTPSLTLFSLQNHASFP